MIQFTTANYILKQILVQMEELVLTIESVNKTFCESCVLFSSLILATHDAVKELKLPTSHEPSLAKICLHGLIV